MLGFWSFFFQEDKKTLIGDGTGRTDPLLCSSMLRWQIPGGRERTQSGSASGLAINHGEPKLESLLICTTTALKPSLGLRCMFRVPFRMQQAGEPSRHPRRRRSLF